MTSIITISIISIIIIMTSTIIIIIIIVSSSSTTTTTTTLIYVIVIIIIIVSIIIMVVVLIIGINIIIIMITISCIIMYRMFIVIVAFGGWRVLAGSLRAARFPGLAAGVCKKNTPPEKKTLGKTGLKNTTSGAGEELFLLCCRAEARVKGVFFCSDTGRIFWGGS